MQGKALPFAGALRARLSDVAVSTKRRPGTASGIEAWYPYYAGYTEEFAATVIEAANLVNRSTVLDPWNGCGTTTRVADALGHNAIGIDINPVATLVASAKLARARDVAHIYGLASRVAKISIENPQRGSIGDPLRRWLCAKLANTYRTIEYHILSDLAVRDGQVMDPVTDVLPPLASFLLLALQRSARRFAGIKITSNPTWLRPKGRPPRHSSEKLTCVWLEMVRSMALDLQTTTAEQHTTGSEVHLGDSRHLPVPDRSVDMVVTSPPYCTRIDYVISTAFELAALGIGEKDVPFKTLRWGSMGTPLARPKALSSAEHLPEQVAKVLKAIQKHPSKSSKSYYYKTYFQYFTDSLASLKELERVLKPGGVAVLVVQSSYYKDIYVDLPQLYQDLAGSLSLRASLAAEFAVSRFLAQINTRSTAHRKSTVHREAVVVLEAV